MSLEEISNEDKQITQSAHEITDKHETNNSNEEIEPTFNIFVGDLRNDITEVDLIQTFSPIGSIQEAHIYRDPNTGESKGFGFVHFVHKHSQQKALTEEWKNVVIKGKICRVSKSERKVTLFVGNLPTNLNQEDVSKKLGELVSGIIHLELKTGPPPLFESRGFCFIQFANHQKAEAARKILSSTSVADQKLSVSWAEKPRDVDEKTMAKVKTLYVSNLAISATDQILNSLFTEYGKVTNCVIVKNQQNQSRGFAFVEFENRDAALSALNQMDGREIDGQKISVVLAKPPLCEKETEKKQSKHQSAPKYKLGANNKKNSIIKSQNYSHSHKSLKTSILKEKRVANQLHEEIKQASKACFPFQELSPPFPLDPMHNSTIPICFQPQYPYKY